METITAYKVEGRIFEKKEDAILYKINRRIQTACDKWTDYPRDLNCMQFSSLVTRHKDDLLRIFLEVGE